MQRIRPVGLPPLPWLSWFHELNVRTYVFDDHGNPGVWFFSLDCNQPIAVEIARRAFNLPYMHARMSSTVDPGKIHYLSHRKNNPAPEAEFTYPLPVTPAPASEGSLEWFLVERYRLFSTDGKGNIFSGMVHHSPYRIEPMHPATYSTTPFALNGFAKPVLPPDSMLSASPVDVSVFPLRESLNHSTWRLGNFLVNYTLDWFIHPPRFLRKHENLITAFAANGLPFPIGKWCGSCCEQDEPQRIRDLAHRHQVARRRKLLLLICGSRTAHGGEPGTMSALGDGK